MAAKWNVLYWGSRTWRFLRFVEPLSKWTCSMGPIAIVFQLYLQEFVYAKIYLKDEFWQIKVEKRWSKIWFTC